jgi:hypothetical protein
VRAGWGGAARDRGRPERQCGSVPCQDIGGPFRDPFRAPLRRPLARATGLAVPAVGRRRWHRVPDDDRPRGTVRAAHAAAGRGAAEPDDVTDDVTDDATADVTHDVTAGAGR